MLKLTYSSLGAGQFS